MVDDSTMAASNAVISYVKSIFGPLRRKLYPSMQLGQECSAHPDDLMTRRTTRSVKCNRLAVFFRKCMDETRDETRPTHL